MLVIGNCLCYNISSMSSYFVTEFTQSLPKILIITDLADFGDTLVTIFAKRNFAAQVVSFADLSSRFAATFAQTTYYKIICLTNLAGNTVTSKTVKTLLAGRHEPIMFLTRFDSTVDIDNINTTIESRKFMENGVLFIQRNGRLYNAQGKLIK